MYIINVNFGGGKQRPYPSYNPNTYLSPHQYASMYVLRTHGYPCRLSVPIDLTFTKKEIYIDIKDTTPL